MLHIKMNGTPAQAEAYASLYKRNSCSEIHTAQVEPLCSSSSVNTHCELTQANQAQQIPRILEIHLETHLEGGVLISTSKC